MQKALVCGVGSPSCDDPPSSAARPQVAPAYKELKSADEVKAAKADAGAAAARRRPRRAACAHALALRLPLLRAPHPPTHNPTPLTHPPTLPPQTCWCWPTWRRAPTARSSRPLPTWPKPCATVSSGAAAGGRGRRRGGLAPAAPCLAAQPPAPTGHLIQSLPPSPTPQTWTLPTWRTTRWWRHASLRPTASRRLWSCSRRARRRRRGEGRPGVGGQGQAGKTAVRWPHRRHAAAPPTPSPACHSTLHPPLITP